MDVWLWGNVTSLLSTVSSAALHFGLENSRPNRVSLRDRRSQLLRVGKLFTKQIIFSVSCKWMHSACKCKLANCATWETGIAKLCSFLQIYKTAVTLSSTQSSGLFFYLNPLKWLYPGLSNRGWCNLREPIKRVNRYKISSAARLRRCVPGGGSTCVSSSQ